jgi:hypothetical protein
VTGSRSRTPISSRTGNGSRPETATAFRDRGAIPSELFRAILARSEIAADASGNNFQGCRRAADLQRQHARL